MRLLQEKEIQKICKKTCKRPLEPFDPKKRRNLIL